MKKSIAIGVALLAAVAFVWLLMAGRDRRPGRARAVERLKSLPYATWTAVTARDGLKNGVVFHDASRASRGVNLYSSENEPGAFLLDMDGNVLLELSDSRPEPHPWKLVKPHGADGFAALAADSALLLVDARSQVRAEFQRGFHHDFDPADDGLLYAIDRRLREVPRLATGKPVRDDHLVALETTGEIVLEVSSADLVLDVPELLAVADAASRPLFDREADVFHTNTISRIRRDVERDGRLLWREGWLLICWRNLNTVAVIDPEVPEIVWHWGDGEIEWPHHPTLLADGDLLVFDNGTERGWSRVIEVDPIERRIVWEYRGDPPESFFSSSRGSSQRLPNGNTLVTDSMSGRVVEVTRDGDTVWEFFEPRTRRKWLRTQRATIYRMTRMPEWPLGGAATPGDDPAEP